MSINKKYILITFLISIFYFNNSYANEHRIGLSFGGIAWGDGLFNLSYDQTGVFPMKNWSLGIEAGSIWNGFLLAPRALYWQHPTMSGFYVGPKAVVGFVNSRNYYYKCNECRDRSDTFIGIGGEGGWLYRFTSGPKGLDLGGGIDVLATNYHIWASLKFSVGYLIP
jgi:hypothetical protein